LELYKLVNKNYYLEKEVLVDKFGQDSYRVLEFGKFYPILGNGYLIENSVAEILEKYVFEQIGFMNNVTVWRKATNQVWDNYSEISLKNHLRLDELTGASSDGYRIYHLVHDAIYVSTALKDRLMEECSIADELEFTNEWPLYGG
jgi:hypothetical protein